MKYVITGHKGLIGTTLKKRLDKAGWECVGTRDPRDKNTPFEGKTADIFFDLAANCKINECIKNPRLAFDNSSTIEEALEYCRKHKIPKIVYFSSSRVLSEEMNPYTESKRYGENLCKAYQKCYGINYLIIRPSTVYGGEDKTNRLMNIWLNKAIKGEDLEICGDENKTLDFTYVDDFLDALFLVLNENNKEHNISGGREIKLKDVAEEIIFQLKSKSKISYKEKEKEQPQQIKIDISSLREKGYLPKVKIQEGIRREICRLI